jgi:hypothetical protein
VRPGARRDYGSVVQHGDHEDRPTWRVTSGEPAPGPVERLLRLLPGWFGIESSVLEYIAEARVKTQGPARPDAGYAKTRQFYASVGFRPLEEIYGLWPGLPCLIMIKSLRTT